MYKKCFMHKLKLRCSTVSYENLLKLLQTIGANLKIS